MKCMMSVDNKHIRRVTDEIATELYGEGWRYVPKSIWKEKVRDVEKPTEEKPTKKKKQLPKQNPIKCLKLKSVI